MSRDAKGVTTNHIVTALSEEAEEKTIAKFPIHRRKKVVEKKIQKIVRRHFPKENRSSNEGTQNSVNTTTGKI